MPAQELLNTAAALHREGYAIVVVNDGSPSECDSVFQAVAPYAAVLTHAENQGKGVALKTGFAYIGEHFAPPYTVVTVDADGQHRPEDVLRVTREAEKHPQDLVLGSRRLVKSDPIKSRIGNKITNVLHHLTTGMRLYDTQTGLRAFSDRNLHKMLHCGGTRYEYEMYMLLNFSREKNIREVFIETVYIDNNSATHFKAVKDSLRIYRVFFRYMRTRGKASFNQT